MSAKPTVVPDDPEPEESDEMLTFQPFTITLTGVAGFGQNGEAIFDTLGGLLTAVCADCGKADVIVLQPELLAKFVEPVRVTLATFGNVHADEDGPQGHQHH